MSRTLPLSIMDFESTYTDAYHLLDFHPAKIYHAYFGPSIARCYMYLTVLSHKKTKEERLYMMSIIVQSKKRHLLEIEITPSLFIYPKIQFILQEIYTESKDPTRDFSDLYFLIFKPIYDIH